jgi:predicted dehydrogenase
VNSSGTIGVGVLGMGPRGITFGVRRVMESDPRARVVAICDRDADQLRYAQADTGLDCAAYTELDQLLADENVDVVINCTDDPDHFTTSLAILEAGIHLYLEKPMAQTVEHCDELIAAWQRRPVVFMVGLELRYSSVFTDLRAIVDAGELGAIKLGTVVDNVSVGGNYYFHGRDRREAYVRSLMLEKGTHSLDLINWYVGSRPTRVFCSAGLAVFGGTEPNDKRCRSCETATSCPYFVEPKGFRLDYGGVVRDMEDYCVWAEEVDVDDHGIILIDYANGARVSYMECHFTPEYSREFTFIGTRGKVQAYYDNEQNFRIVLTKRHSDRVDERFPAKLEGAHGGGDPRIIRTFFDLVERGEPIAHGVESARDSAAIAIAALLSRKSGMPVAVPALSVVMQ